MSISDLLKIIKESKDKPQRDEMMSFIHQRMVHTGVQMLPDDILVLMAKIGRVYQPESVIDINCGVGTLLQKCDYTNIRIGIDRNQDIIRLAEYLYPEIDFQLGNILDDVSREQFDLVISALPFGQRIRRDGKSYPIEKLMLEKAFSLLNDGGVVVCLLPGNLLTALIYEDIRKRVLEEYALDMVMTLPSGSILNSGIQTCIVVIRKGKAKNNVYLAEYQKNVSSIIRNFKEGTGDFQIPLKKIKNRWDRHFHDPKFDEIEFQLQGEQVAHLEDISDISRGFRVHRGERREKGKYLILSPRHYKAGRIAIDERSQYVNNIDNERFQRAILREGDIVISLIFNPSLYVYKKDDQPSIASDNLAIIRSRDNKYISTFLQTSDGLNLFLEQAERKIAGATIRHLSIRDLRNIRIPILPLTDLNVVSNDEIEEATQDELFELREQLAFYKKLYEKERLRANEQVLRFLDERFNRVDSVLESVKSKIDKLMSIMKATQQEIQVIKQTPRDEEEKLIRIYSKLDDLSNVLSDHKRTIGEYINIVQNWLEQWDLLDDASMKFLSSAEHLFDKIYQIGDDDYSPFIIQYCRALENELLKKLFEAYHIDVHNRIANIPDFTSKDLDNEKTTIFAKFVKQDNRAYTLGQMVWIMQLIKLKSKTLRQSDLLQDFRDFALRYFEEQIIDKEYLGRIRTISEEFRNKAAHPNILGLDIAQTCQKKIRTILIEFLRNYIVS